MTSFLGWKTHWKGQLYKEPKLNSITRPRHALGRASIRFGVGYVFRKETKRQVKEILLGISPWPFLPTRGQGKGYDRINLNILLLLMALFAIYWQPLFILLTFLLYLDALLVLGCSFFLEMSKSKKVLLKNLASRRAPLHSSIPGLCVRRLFLSKSFGLLFMQKDPEQKDLSIRSLLIGISFWPFISAADAHICRDPDLSRGRCVSLNIIPIIVSIIVTRIASPILGILFFAYLCLIWYETTPFDAVRPRDINTGDN
ncbi:hypothetical protein [Candidatus Similichlamydia epinepheli]|uniref:hypothetical protein n=1 Tax=Candidatus Similichlamydia epinepheli TaxID=1903953 RepID=UPI000D373D56|nr:hypothetical protein [Candidatus Similichlamydia epinepheli]